MLLLSVPIFAVVMSTIVLALVRWQSLRSWLFDTYRPELHYMRGPGPKWREKHGSFSLLSAHRAAPERDRVSRHLEPNGLQRRRQRMTPYGGVVGQKTFDCGFCSRRYFTQRWRQG